MIIRKKVIEKGAEVDTEVEAETRTYRDRGMYRL